MLVSIIIPIYNGEKYLYECIDSILNQSSKNYELILVDDGSQDRSLEICKQYERNNSSIKVIVQKNQGVSVARQTGINHANGEWILFVDVDDCLKKDAVYELSKCSENDMVIFSGRLDIKDQKKWSGRNEELIDEIIGRYKRPPFQNVNMSTVWSKAYRKRIILENNLKFIEKLGNGEDMLFNIAYILNCNEIMLKKISIYSFRRNHNSVSYRYSEKAIETDYLFLKELEVLLPQNSKSSENSLLYEVTLNGFWTCLRQNIAHPENNEDFHTKRNKIDKIISLEPYKTAIRNWKNLCHDRKKRIVFYLLQNNLYRIAILITALSRKSGNKREEIIDM